MKKKAITNYHAVRWREPIIYELGRKGRRGFMIPKVEPEIKTVVRDAVLSIPEKMRRKTPPDWPELSEPEVVRHFIRLSQQTFGVDSGINVGVGTCTMKYNPKVNEVLARSPGITGLHPLQDASTVQGILEIIYKLQEWLCEISGMDKFSFQPRGGAHAVFANACIIRAFHKYNGELDQRDEIITTVVSHPCNAAAPASAGFKIVTLYPDEKTGCINIEALKAAVSKRTAGMMITNPYDTGIFDSNITEYINIIHEAGGLVAIDQANANCLLGRVRIGDVGADLCHFNLHKSFSTPHGSCGPGSAPIGVKEEFAKFLPIPTVEFDGSRYYLDYDRPHSIGKVAEFHGVAQNVVRAYAWILSMGAEGLRETSEVAVLNNNYLLKKLLEVRGVSLPWDKSHPFRMQDVRLSLEKLKEETGIKIDDVNRRIVDFGVQRCFTSHEPWIVPEPFTPEPTESASKEDLDMFAEIFRRISTEAYTNPEKIKKAPHNCAISRINLSPSSDPKKWAMTWRAYIKKHG
jgi:glycine dehydrogenase subunit 2